MLNTAMNNLRKEDPSFPEIYPYRLNYQDIDCDVDDLRYYAEFFSIANYKAGLAYLIKSVPVWQPELGYLHHVIIQIPQDNEVISFMQQTGIDKVILNSNTQDSMKLGWASGDIRQALGGYNRKRLGVLLAGSPDCGTTQKNQKQRCRSKNEGYIQSILNDANLMFHLIHALSPNNFLSGAVFAGLIKTKKALLDLLSMLRTTDGALVKKYIEPQKEVLGTLYVNSMVPGHMIRGGFLYNFRERGNTIGGMMVGAVYGPSVEIECERLVGPISTYVPFTFQSDYAVLYYSGHGSPKGIRIEKNEIITPQELATICAKHNIHLFLILDMCYAARFAEGFTSEMREYGSHSVVMCSNDQSNKYESYESDECNNLWRFNWPVDILRRDINFGTGAYTTAFSLGLLCLREFEIRRSQPVTISIQDFNDKVLRRICSFMSKSHDIEIQRPVIFSS